MKHQTQYRSEKGTRWALMQIFDIPAHDDNNTYLRRYRVIQTPLCALYLHKIMRPDADRELHDHPWAFIPLILRGGYIEEREGGQRVSRDWLSVRYMRATTRHRIVRLSRVPTWTLCLVGRRKRNWGFYTPTGWVPWQQFLGVSSGA